MSHPPVATGRKSDKSVRFRSDIQGMRALAVLAIIVYHAGFELYPGGFVTLDVFFVISGFLITHLLVLEIRRTGRLSLYDFYRRRARRILPAATVAAVGTVIASWLWLSLIEAEDAARDAIWSAVFAANIRFALEQTDYFAESQPPSPFQHFWSLSVEEQFYAGLPIVLVGCIVLAAWLARRYGAAPGDPVRVAFVVVAAISALSLAWSIHASSASPESAYFSTFTRIWEFGVGAMLAMAAPRLARSLTARARNLLALAGLGAIVYACLTVTPLTPYPGHLALWPVLGTGAIMLAGAELRASERPPLVQRALGVGPLRLIGDASYSLYLWHWPVLTIATQHLGREMSTRGLAIALVVIFAASFASYRWVERPFRQGLLQRWGRGLALYPIAVGAVALVSAVVVQVTQVELDDGGPPITTAKYPVRPDGAQLASDPTIARVQASARAASENAPIPADLSPGLLDLSHDKADVGDCDYRDPPPWDLCPRGEPDADRSIVVLGNSHGRHWIPAFEQIGQRTGHTVYYLVKPQCTAARVDKPRKGDDEPWQECQEFNTWAEQQVAELNPDLVVISTSGSQRVTFEGMATGQTDLVVEAFKSGFAELIEAVRSPAGDVVVLGDVPRRRSDPGECLSQRDTHLGDCASEPAKRAAQITATSKQAAARQGARFIDTKPWFCSGRVCPAVIGATIPMRDHSHITTAYAEELAEPLRKALDLALE